MLKQWFPIAATALAKIRQHLIIVYEDAVHQTCKVAPQEGDAKLAAYSLVANKYMRETKSWHPRN
jgi:hypothetical protein